MEELESVARPLNSPGSQQFMEAPNRHASAMVAGMKRSFIMLTMAVELPASAFEQFRDL
jgi:hypothetical protein